MPELDFTVVDTVPIDDDGRSEVVTVAAPGSGPIAIRVRPSAPAAPEVCYQLEDVTTQSGQTLVAPADQSSEWGPYCRDCSQRVAVGQHFGFFVLPNDGEPLPAGGAISLRVSLRHCSTLIPLTEALAPGPDSVIVEVSSWPAPSPDAALSLPILLVDAVDEEVDPFLNEIVLEEAEGEVAAILGSAGVEATFVSSSITPWPERAVAYGPLDEEALDALFADAVSSWVGPQRPLPVIFVPCLAYEDPVLGQSRQPRGHTTRLPGGSSVDGAADAVFVATAQCGVVGSTQWTAGLLLGRLIAHEVGHALGLFHTVEPSGTEDHLPDTTPDQGNLMHYVATSSSELSPRQIHAVRQSPFFALP